ncbi:hypothetical protein [Ktedonobacter sp. SOSP1-52]|uniref:hypothetical protein n=1 Tax=Ktedonobacter sp. SOSP1-52 TaxID=2778366 RepID=UPI0019151D68|nr:hypothetical protein [Ktedonobacter sp. SOSP1-52]
MKSTLARTGGFLVLLAGAVGLVSFLFLPVGFNPIYFRTQSGLQLLQFYAYWWDSFVVPMRVSYATAWQIGYWSMWAILIIFGLNTLFGIIMVLTRKPSIVLPLLCLLLSLLAVCSLFLMFDAVPISGENLLLVMLRNMFGDYLSPYPITGLGWWVCILSTLLILVCSLSALMRRSATKDVTSSV